MSINKLLMLNTRAKEEIKVRKASAIKEMLRDLVGTVKANGNTNEIIDAIMEEVNKRDKQIDILEVSVIDLTREGVRK